MPGRLSSPVGTSPALELLDVAARPVATRREGWLPDQIRLRTVPGHVGVPDAPASWFLTASDETVLEATVGLDPGIVLAALPALRATLRRLGSDAERQMFNGPTYSLQGVGVSSKDASEVLALEVCATNYYSAALTNRALPAWLLRDRNLPSRVPVFGLANQLGVNVGLVTSDERIIVATRGHAVPFDTGRHYSPVGGVVDREKPADLRSVLHATIRREAYEEAGIEADEQNILIHGLVLSLDRLQLIVGGAIHCAEPAKSILAKRGVDTDREVAERVAYPMDSRVDRGLFSLLVDVKNWEAVSLAVTLQVLEEVLGPRKLIRNLRWALAEQ